MFRTTAPAVESASDVSEISDGIPLSHLELDLPAPPLGWMLELDRRGIQVITDDLGRLAISREDARTLIVEHNANEARRREVAAENERQAVERDRQFRAQLGRGVHWLDMPPNIHPAAAMLAADEDSRVSVREQLLQQELAHLNGADS